MHWLSIELYSKGMIKFGEFKLSSGLISPYYVDLRRLYSYPELAQRIVKELIQLIPLNDIDVIAGIETAGIPLASFISCTTRKPLAYIRKEAKTHGTGNLIEGDVVGKKTMIVDDVVTTGSSLLRAINHVKNTGGLPTIAVVVVDREQGARELLEKHGVRLISLTTSREIFRDLHDAGILSLEMYHRLLDYVEKMRKE